MGQRRESNICQARRQSDDTLRERRTALFAPRPHIGFNALTRNKRPNRSTAAPPRPLWQRVLAGERLPKRLSRHPKCEGTVEDHRPIALDVFHLNLAYPWLGVMQLNSSSLDLQLVTGRAVMVPLVWASCGVVGERLRLACPLCGRRVCTLYQPRRKSRVSALQWPLVCGTTDQQYCAKVSDDAKNPPEARRLWPDLECKATAKAARHVAADLRAALCCSSAH
jgi:hypothetical protein